MSGPDGDAQVRPRGVRTSLSALNAADVRGGWLPPLVDLCYNPLTFIGLFLVNAAVVVWLFVLPVAAHDGARHPYLLIFFLGVLPLVLLLGVALISWGIRRRYRGAGGAGAEPRSFSPIGWENREFRHLAAFVVVVTGVNVVAGGYLSQRTVHYMDSPRFCSGVCHSMAPEAAAYLDSPHQNIGCVECHIGSGRSAYVQAKLNGLWQVAATVLERHPRPIPTPLENLRPAREICESCHWPRKFGGVQIRVLDHFADDSLNTHTRTVLAVAVGGGPVAAGIHGSHVGEGATIEFIADSLREEVFWVRYRNAAGADRVYATPGWDTAPRGPLVRRQMDCLGCHSRPSHAFLQADRAIDEALASGALDRSLPWIRAQAIRVITADYHSAADAAERIPWALMQAFRTDHPAVFWARRAEVERAGRSLARLYRKHVFPEMGIAWGTYPDLSGHAGGGGCFRCHGGGQLAADGRGITRDCRACHQILALDEREPAILAALGMTRWRTNGIAPPPDSGASSIYHLLDYGATGATAR